MPEAGVGAGGGWRVDEGPARAECVAVLATAFRREPAVRWICGDSPRTPARWFDATLRAHRTVPGSRWYVLREPDGRAVAAAVLSPPGGAPGAVARLGWSLRTALGCGPRAVRRTIRYLEAAEAAAPDDARTLEFVGVRPEAAGQGCGGALLRHVLDTATADCFLTTADPANVPLYRHLGFTVTARHHQGPLEVTAMTRPAGPAPGGPSPV
ncbi:GNAT family N-acetyltransferase [Streptomyces durbertensis]|uniref:GNAT family N-acetyltransferase n=1 Tax=Streptomyces durbertensis TaxID=2448886 RepID=A0ABR6EIV8_9ACTN|nr:GNAT family N-acetyltransferase [Streptomyces durbertensis]MBB1245246.1 GNAT family N-acetyltransferase [Streptomyces durbertensis]